MTANHDFHHCPLQVTPTPQLREFRVVVGHWDLRIQAMNAQSAIDEAKRTLCRQLPRLWDVIHTLAPDRFSVTTPTDSKQPAKSG